MRSLVGIAVLAAISLASVPVEAHGLFGRCGGGGCETGCAPATVTYEERQVTCYRCEVKSKTVPTVINKVVTRCVEEPCKYTIYKPVYTEEKRTVTCYRCVAKEIPYTWNECVPVPAQEKRTVTCYRQQFKEVPCTVFVPVQVVVPQKQTVVVCRYEPQEVVRQVPVCQTVRKDCIDPCTGCVRTVCQPVTVMQDVKCTVMKAIPEQKEVIVNVIRCEMQERQGTRTVCELIPETKEVMVNVCRFEVVQRKGTKIMYENIPETKEVTVQVCRYEPIVKDGVRQRIVCDTVQETVNVTHTWVEQVPYTTTIKVPVCK